MTRAFLACLAAAGLSACAAIQPPQPPALKDPPLPLIAPQVRKPVSGGLFVAETVRSLTSDRRALRPGDLLTVNLQETTRASKKADTQMGKGANIAVKPGILAGRALKTDIGVGGQSDFSGSAASSQQNALFGAITVVVHEVLPGGVLRVQGEKRLHLNQGEEMVRLSGYVRTDDIDANNQVSSLRIANANIVYAGQGTLADVNNAGWLSRFFVSPWMPF